MCRDLGGKRRNETRYEMRILCSPRQQKGVALGSARGLWTGGTAATATLAALQEAAAATLSAWQRVGSATAE